MAGPTNPGYERMSDVAQDLRIADPAVPRPLDRYFWLALLLAAAVLVPRSIAIARAHSESWDDSYHLTRGLAFLTRSLDPETLLLNDPPFGEGLVALPLLAANLLSGREAREPGLYDHPLGPEALAVLLAVWKVVLFLPLIGVVFHWCRTLYGLHSAWLAVAMLCVEPTFAAHLPIPALDTLGVAGVVIGGFLGWRFFQGPTPGRLVAAGVGISVALMLKHTALILPVIMAMLAGLWWGIKPWREGQDWDSWRAEIPGRRLAILRMACVVLATLCVLSGFDLATNYYIPFFRGIAHMGQGHAAYLLGRERTTGWWYYFPVVAWYKVPIGIAVVLLLGLLSLGRTPPRWAEWGLFIPLLALLLSLLTSKINIGVRHFLPAYTFLLMLASRCVARGGWTWSAAAWGAVAVAGLHAASFHPDYLGYMNAPRHKPYLAISDSNVDWGQALKQARAWIDARPRDGRPISLRYFGYDSGNLRYYLGDRAVILKETDPPPTTGLLIISPVFEAGLYDDRDAYVGLQPYEPVAVIGHSLLVYDLDRLGGGKPFRWPAPTSGRDAPESPRQ
jgi:hypothetical protein